MTDDEILKRADEIRAARAETFRAEAAAVEARVQSLSTKGVTPLPSERFRRHSK
jgi:hypothetical protein